MSKTNKLVLISLALYITIPIAIILINYDYYGGIDSLIIKFLLIPTIFYLLKLKYTAIVSLNSFWLGFTIMHLTDFLNRNRPNMAGGIFFFLILLGGFITSIIMEISIKIKKTKSL